MAQIETNVTLNASEDDQTMDILTNLSRDLDTLDDRLSRLSEQGVEMSLNVKDGEVIATVNEN